MGKKNIIAFSGINGANADLACRQAFPYMETKACPSFYEAMQAVERHEADLCMIPIENSHVGRVAEIHNLLPKTNLFIVGEYFQSVENHLLAPKGTQFEDIKTIYSHPHALLQCKKKLHDLEKGLKRHFQLVDYANTATAAKDVAQWQDKSKAAIASELAAELYGLDIVKRNIEDAKDNTTIFMVMSAEPADPDAKKSRVITSLLFTARNIPAALYKALGGFATNHVNMLKIESYIPSGKSQMAQFFISFEGTPQQENVKLALEELGFFCKKVKVLGVYPADPKRFE